MPIHARICSSLNRVRLATGRDTEVATFPRHPVSADSPSVWTALFVFT